VVISKHKKLRGLHFKLVTFAVSLILFMVISFLVPLYTFFSRGTDAGSLSFRADAALELSAVIFDQQKRICLFLIVIIAAAAGIAAAFIFSDIVLKPFRKLLRHIETVRGTEDKTKLAGINIDITTNDEIAVISETVNDMTHRVVNAAFTECDLKAGKEIQKKFIPLDTDSRGNLQPSGFLQTPNLSFFGYYESAMGVSGDYFNYKDLDGRYYAVIKCDVAGTGVPAALIMVQVATIFLSYFKQWEPDAKGFCIENLAYQINDLIETIGFNERFAAFTLCLFDSKTGTVRFCNAGDNVVHFYDASEGMVKTIAFPQTPAAGVLPNYVIEAAGGYNVHTVQIDPGDILLLYTDGIEEAKRRFRDKGFKETACAAGPADTPHENHLRGQVYEEFGQDRIAAVINSVMAGGIYTLRKRHNPEGGMDLQFDFSSCKGHVDEVIMAMISAEKMFRCYKPENAGKDALVLIDKKIDEFLKKHFLQYNQYCSYTRNFPENPAYMYYTHVMEDEQYDDLAILGIKRISKEREMTFSERMKEMLEQGWAASKDFAVKAGAKAQDLGERGVLMWDIKQLENQAQKCLARLGNETYIAFTEREQSAIDRDAVEFRSILDELAIIKDQIEKKEFDLKNRK